MTKVLWDERFKKIYRSKVKNNDILKKKFWSAIEIFAQYPFDERLRTHKLTGKLEGLWAFSVAFDCRVIFSFIRKHEALLVDIGSHDEVY